MAAFGSDRDRYADADEVATLTGIAPVTRQSGKTKVVVEGLIVFTRNPDINVEECDYEAIPLNELRQTVRGLQYDVGGERTDDEGA